MDFLHQQFLNNTILDYIYSALILLVGFIIIYIIKVVIIAKLEKKAKLTTNKIDDFLINLFKRTLMPVLFFGIFYLSIQYLNINASISKIFKTVGLIIITLIAIKFLISLINYVFLRYLLKGDNENIKEQSVKSLMPIIKIAIYSSGLFFLLDNLGFQISALIAGLGIGGVAVALAGQALLKDLFSYFAILFDRPFEIGDFIIAGDYLGTIEHVGIKTTRLRSLGGEELIFSNADLTDSRLRNYKRMQERRVVFKLGVTYQTSSEKLKQIPEIIKNIIKNIENTRFDRAHFNAYGDFSLGFEIVYYVLTNDYNKYMDIQQNINLSIYEEFEKREIEFAYPTQTVFVNKNQ